MGTDDLGTMTGGQAAIATAVDAGIEVCFANAGTTEIHMVEALDRYPQVRPVLGLFEGVCSGAADGYARVANKPALTLLHLGPGYANSAANQHNARRAFSPIINLIGDQADWHLEHDAALTSDIDAIAGWAGWVGRSTSANDVGAVTAEAIAAATTGIAQTASVVLAANHTWQPVTSPLPGAQLGSRTPVDESAVAASAKALGEPGAALIVGGRHISSSGKRAMVALQAATGCKAWIGRHSTSEEGDGLNLDMLPYFPEPLIGALAGTSVAVLAGVPEPVTFFGYPDTPPQALPPDAERIQLCDPGHDLDAVLQALCAAVGTSPASAATPTKEQIDSPAGQLTSDTLAQAVMATMPEGAIFVQEAVSNRAGLSPFQRHANPFIQLNGTGGAIGGGLPMALGAGVAASGTGRRVVSYQADGSGLYTIQSLWSIAREQLDVTIVVINNRSYKIIEVEAHRAGLDPGEATRSLYDLDRPEVDFGQLANGFGMASARTSDAGELVDLLTTANREPGPFLVDATI